MFDEILKLLFGISRKCGKTASVMTDIKTLASGNPKKIGKRIVKKTVSKVAREVSKKI